MAYAWTWHVAGNAICAAALISGVFTGCCRVRPLRSDNHRLLIGCGPTSQVYTLEEILDQAKFPGKAAIETQELCATTSSSVLLVRISGAEQPHRHPEHDLVVQIIAGHGTMLLGDRSVDLDTGDIVIVQRGVMHAYSNKDPAGSVAVVVRSPGQATAPTATPD